MKKNFSLLFLLVGFFGFNFIHVQALTSVDSQDLGGSECFHTNPIDTITCASFRTITTYNTPSPEGPVEINVTHELNDNGGTAATGMLTCGGGGAGSCTSTDVSSDVKGQTGGLGGPVTLWGNIPRGPNGSVIPTLTADTYDIAIYHYVSGASGLQGCVWTGGSCNIMPENETTTGGTLVVEAAPPASVQLLISQYLDKAITRVLSLIGLVNNAYAQTKAVNATSTQKPSTAIVVANINLTNPQIAKINADSYYVSFTLTNKGETQPDVYYTFSLVDTKNTTVSIQTVPKALTLEKDTPFFATEKLATPKGLSGTYTVRVQAYTQTGLPLGFGTAGKITLVGVSAPALSDCSLLKKSYDVNQMLSINCSVKNLTSKDYIVSSKVFYENEPRERKTVSSEVVNSEATTKIAGLTTPGVYTIRTGLYERNGTPVGKEVANTFTIKGTSVSILNLLLDKNRYARGEEAKVAISLSVFSSVTPLKGLTVSATLRGNQGECANPYSLAIGGKRAIEFMMPVTATCKNPLLTVQVLNDKKVVLAEKSIQLISKQAPLDLKTKVGYGAALALLLMATFSLLRRAKIHGVASIVRKVAKKK